MISAIVSAGLIPVLLGGGLVSTPVKAMDKEITLTIELSAPKEHNYEVEGEVKYNSVSDLKDTKDIKGNKDIKDTKDIKDNKDIKDIKTEGQSTEEVSPDKMFEQLKNQLNEKFAYMFELKRELDALSEMSNSKWQEYHALNEAYNKQFKRIIAMWSFDMSANYPSARPMPYRR